MGTISEYLGLLGQKIFSRNFRLGRWIDIPLRGLKYFLLGFFVWAISSMSTDAIASFLHSDYGLVAGVKMLNFFRFLGEIGLIVIGILVLASVFVQNFLVLLSLYLRRFTGICFLIEPRAHSPRARALH